MKTRRGTALATWVFALPGMFALLAFVLATPWERDWMALAGNAPPTIADAIAHPRSAFGYWYARNPEDDPRLYFEMASLALGRGADLQYLASKRGRDAGVRGPDGTVRVPYRDFAFEYPPLALALMVPMRLVTNDVATYVRLFAAQMALIVGLLFVVSWLLLRRTLDDAGLAAPCAAAAFSAYVMTSGGIVVDRFDAFVALTTALALVAAIDDRHVLAAVLLGVGTATKLWPLVLVPLVIAGPLRARNGRRAMVAGAAAVIAFLAVHAPFAPAAGVHVFDYLRYHGARGIQLESTYSSFLLLAHHAGWIHARVGLAYGSAEISAGAATRAAVVASYPVMFALIGAAYVWAARASARTRSGTREASRVLLTSAIAVVTALLLSAKVLSPQYLVWLAPIVFTVGSRDARAIAITYVAACLLTQILFPRQYVFLLWLTPRGTLLLCARNACLATLFFLALRALQRGDDTPTCAVTTDARSAGPFVAAPACVDDAVGMPRRG
jgi:hypothetical protein